MHVHFWSRKLRRRNNPNARTYMKMVLKGEDCRGLDWFRVGPTGVSLSTK